MERVKFFSATDRPHTEEKFIAEKYKRRKPATEMLLAMMRRAKRLLMFGDNTLLFIGACLLYLPSRRYVHIGI